MAGRKRKIQAGRLSHSAITTKTIKGELRRLGVYGDPLGEENFYVNAHHDARNAYAPNRYNPMTNARELPVIENNAYRLMRLCEQWVEEEENRYKAWQKRFRHHLENEILEDRKRIRKKLKLSVEQLPLDPDAPIASASEGEIEDESEDESEDEDAPAGNRTDIAAMVHALTGGDGPPAQALAPAPAPAPAPEPVEDEGDTDHNLYEEKAAANNPYVEGTVLGRRRAKQNPRWWMYKVKFDDDTEDWYSTKEVKHFIAHYNTVNK